MKNIIIVIVGLIILGGLIIYARPQGSSKDNGAGTGLSQGVSSLTAEETTYDFGSISMAAGPVRHTFKIKNSGTVPLTLTKLYTSCMCTTAVLETASGKRGPFGMPGHGIVPKINKSIAAGEEMTIEVEFDPAAHGPAGVGPTVRSVYLETASGKPLELRIKSLVTP